MISRFTLAVLLTVIISASYSNAALGIELVGVTQATLQWEPASGPVAGYSIIVSRNGEAASVEETSDDTRATVAGGFGDTLVVWVSAYDAAGISGPISPASVSITFIEAGDGGAGSGSTGGDPNGGSGDPEPGAPPLDSIAPLDFTGDGRSDLLIRRADGESLALWTMNGHSVVAVSDLPRVPASWDMVGNGDYDGDGTADILWEDLQSGNLVIWYLDAGEPFRTEELDMRNLEFSGDWKVGGSADFDADGRDEVLVFSRSLGVAEIFSPGGNAAASHTRIDAHTGAWTVAATLDVDGDDVAEIVWRDEIGEILVLARLDGAGRVSNSPLAGSVAGVRVVGSGDFDADERGDLLMQWSESGALEVWLLDGSSVSEIQELSGAVGAGLEPLGRGDYDGNGFTDVVWSSPVDARVDLWLGSSDAIDAGSIEGGELAPGDWIASGTQGSDERDFYARLCDGDIDGNGKITKGDVKRIRRCLGGSASRRCEGADLDGDGWITDIDLALFENARAGLACGDGS
jgi:hypothetical protein